MLTALRAIASQPVARLMAFRAATARKNEVTELSDDDSAEGPGPSSLTRPGPEPPATTPEAAVKKPLSSSPGAAKPASAAKSKVQAEPASSSSPKAKSSQKAKASPKAKAKSSSSKAKAKSSPKAKAKCSAKTKAKGKAKSALKGKGKAKAKSGASRRSAEAEELVAEEGEEEPEEVDEAEEMPMHRPAAVVEPEEPVTDEVEAEEAAAPMRRPAAGRGLKRPAAALRVYKYMYHKKHMWGIKINGKEVMQASSR